MLKSLACCDLALLHSLRSFGWLSPYSLLCADTWSAAFENECSGQVVGTALHCGSYYAFTLNETDGDYTEYFSAATGSLIGTSSSSAESTMTSCTGTVPSCTDWSPVDCPDAGVDADASLTNAGEAGSYGEPDGGTSDAPASDGTSDAPATLCAGLASACDEAPVGYPCGDSWSATFAAACHGGRVDGMASSCGNYSSLAPFLTDTTFIEYFDATSGSLIGAFFGSAGGGVACAGSVPSCSNWTAVECPDIALDASSDADAVIDGASSGEASVGGDASGDP